MKPASPTIRIEKVEHTPIDSIGKRRLQIDSKWSNEKEIVRTVMHAEVKKEGRSIRRFVLGEYRDAMRLGVTMTDMKRREGFEYRLTTKITKADDADEWYLLVLLFDSNKFTFGIDITL